MGHGLKISRRALLAVGMLLLSSQAAHAELSLWELGIGLGGASLPEYRGSDEQQNYLVPIPYIIYRGERFSMDRRGMRGMLFSTERMNLDISADFGIPVHSDNNQARTGMADLDFMLHLGPSLEFTLHEEFDHGDVFKLIFPAQAIITLDLSEPGTHGWVFYPHVNYVKRWTWTVSLSAGPMFATRDYHQYYYGIDTADATAQRPAYEADGGYTGTRVSLSLARRIGNIWWGAYARYENLSDAAYANSPLIRSNNAVAVGLGVSWVILRSQRAASDVFIPDPDEL